MLAESTVARVFQQRTPEPAGVRRGGGQLLHGFRLAAAPGRPEGSMMSDPMSVSKGVNDQGEAEAKWSSCSSVLKS